MHDMKVRGDFAADRRILLLAAIAVVVGAVCSVVAAALLGMIRLFTNLFFFQELSLVERSPAEHQLGALVIVVPVVGSLIIGLMARFGSEKIRGHGIPEALEAILYGKSLMNPKVAVLKPLSSGVSIGSGGPFGAEGPIIMTGGAFGSLIAQLVHVSAAERKTLLVAGAAAGMSAVFASPIAAVLLSVELLLFEWRPRSLIPVALAASVSAALRTHLLGTGPLFPMPPHPAPVGWELVVAAGVGVSAGALSALLSWCLYRLEDAFHRLPIHWMWWPAMGGLVVGIGGYLQPRALGVGYDVIADLVQGRMTDPHQVLPLLAVKCGIWLVALASGTSGGVLAPLLIMGAGLGQVESAFLPESQHLLWPLVGMAAVLGGMMRAPLTAVVFALELTHDLAALRPLLVAAVCAYAFTVLVMKRSILTEKLARRGRDIFREYGVDPLERLRVQEVMTHDVVVIASDSRADRLLETHFSGRHKHRGYPVVDGTGAVLGVLTPSDMLALDGDPHRVTAGELLKKRLVVAYPLESCRVAAERMAREGIGRLVVVDPAAPTRVIGILTRSDLMKSRHLQVEEEEKLERFLFPGSSEA